jgi:tetratricopeptide (TPR) repeat protein
MAVGAVVLTPLLAVSGWIAWERPSWRASFEVRQALAAGRYDDAWAVTGRWLQARPRSAEAHFLRAKAALALGNRRALYDNLREAQALGYREDQLALLRALINAQNGRVAEAEPVLARAFVESGPPDPLVDEALARLYLELYDFPHAGAVLTRWAEDAPNDPRPPWWRARTNLRREADPEVIIADYREALRRDPKLAEARLGLADVLRQEHRNTEADAEYATVLAVEPENAAALLGAGRNALELGDLDGAARRLDRALTLDPGSADAHKERATLFLHLGDAASALGHLDRAVAIQPYDPALHYSRRLALSRLGRRDEAKQEQQDFDRLKAEIDQMNALRGRLAETPGDARLQGELARWMFAHGYAREGLSWARKILITHPGHPETCLLLANYYNLLGRPDLARFYRAQITSNRALSIREWP